MSERAKGYFSLYILCMLYNKLTFYVCCTSIYLIFNVCYNWNSMYAVKLADILCTCTMLNIYLTFYVCCTSVYRNWTQPSLVFVSSKIDPEHHCYRGTIKCNMMRLVTMRCYDIMIMNNYDWKLIVEIKRKLFWQSKYVLRLTWLRHQDLVRFVAITTITLWLRLGPQSCCKSW